MRIILLPKKSASVTIRYDEGGTASHWAAEMSNTDVSLRYYVSADADFFSTNQYGETLFYYAAAGGKHETIEFLLSRGSFDENAANSTSWTPTTCALASHNRVYKTEAGAVKSARLLLRLGDNLKAVTIEGWMILHILGSFENLKSTKH